MNIKRHVKELKGIGEKKEKCLLKLGIKNIEDLLYYFPINYEDRTEIKKLIEIKDGELANIQVEVKGRASIRKIRKNMIIIKVPITDGTDVAYLTFFNQTYRLNQFEIGEKLYLSGKCKINGLIKEFNNPKIEKNVGGIERIGQIDPIYSLTKGLNNKDLKKFMKEALKYIENLDDIPEYIREKYDLISLKDSIENLHFPKNRDMYLKSRKTLSFMELLEIQLGLLFLKNKRTKDIKVIEFDKTDILSDFEKILPFSLTNSQKKVIKEIDRNMNSKKQMNRLVQGDVGSGKTIVAAFALLKAVKSGYQGSLMAPTEILARQHYENLIKIFKDYELNIDLIVSNLKTKEKREVKEKVESGITDIVVGTHALIEEDIQFYNMGIAITDEQHRFGVNQRAKLANKGINPDILVMTATPIPRTLALITYGDLDISVIDELPPGRKVIRTFGRKYNSREKVYDFIETQIKKGRQAYVVCPMVAENEIMKLNSVENVYDELKEKYRELNIGLLHGKMKANEKEAIMKAFKENKINILVSTTVIEVGVDVPNANIMIVENAERFGLSQLHQLRGRVGRGTHQSYCVLLMSGNSKIAYERIKTMQETNNGFLISEKDLELRGPGEFFGLKQHGIPELKVAKLPRDLKLLSEAQSLAKFILNEDPYLKNEKNKYLKEKIKLKIQI